MDIRKSNVPDIVEENLTNDEAASDFLIKTDSVTESRRMNESIIFNLVQKIKTIEEMKIDYNKTRNVYESGIANYLGSYVHTGAAPIVFLSAYFYLLYKRRSNIYNVTGWLCFATGINEIGKYIYIRKGDPAKSEQYDEYSRNYKSLMKSYEKGITLKLMIFSILGINHEDYDTLMIKNFCRQKIPNQFSEEIILSKYI